MAKSKYETNVKDKLILVEGWARNEFTDEQIAKNLEISKTTFYKYIKEHSELSERLKKGKEVIDFEVENALLKRVLGYKYKEVSKEEELNITKEVIKKVVPDTTSQIFWLKNRKPEEWRDKQNIKHSGDMNVNNSFENLTTEQLLKLAGEEDG